MCNTHKRGLPTPHAASACFLRLDDDLHTYGQDVFMLEKKHEKKADIHFTHTILTYNI